MRHTWLVLGLALAVLLPTAADAQTPPNCRLIWRDDNGALVDVRRCDQNLTNRADVTITNLGGGEWQLEVINLYDPADPTVVLDEVDFPWVDTNPQQTDCSDAPFALNGDPSDDIMIDTYILGGPRAW